MCEKNDTVYHERANHEDNLHVSRTNAFISVNGFVAVAVGLTNETWLRLVFSLMVLSIDIAWARWASQASIFIRALRDAGQDRADEQLWRRVIRCKFSGVASLNIMSLYIPRFLTLAWFAICLLSVYKLLQSK